MNEKWFWEREDEFLIKGRDRHDISSAEWQRTD
jgi:hypothetical protein